MSLALIVILNLVLSLTVFAAIVGLLVAGIVSDRRGALALRRHRRVASAERARPQRASQRSLRPAFDA